MGRSRAATWIAGTVVAALVIVAGGWLLLIAPQFDTAAEADEERSAVEAQNEVLTIQNAALRVQYEQLDDLKAELEELRVGIPMEAQVSDVVRELHALAEASGVSITDLVMSDATVVDTTPEGIVTPEPSTPVEDGDVAEEQDADGENGADEETAEDQPSLTTDGAPLLDGLYAIPLTVTLEGSYEGIRTFLNAVQTETDRLFLAATLAATAVLVPGGGGAIVPVEPGDVNLSVSGMVFVLVDPDAQPEPVELGPMPEGTGHNPFLPVVGVDLSDDDEDD